MDILDEIKEDLRSEQARKFWAKYKNLLIGAIAALVLVTVAGSGYRQYAQYRATNDAQSFNQAIDLAEDQKRDEALQKLASMADGASNGYKTLALFSQASIQMKSGDKKGAAEAYDRLSKTSGIDPMYRELATIYRAAILLDMDKPDLAALNADLEPLTLTGRPWRYSALEMQGLIAMQSGDKAKAKNIFARIAADKDAPNTMKIRAGQVSDVLSY